MNYHEKCVKLRTLLGIVKDKSNPKGVKEVALRDARALAENLGFVLGDYNSDNFSIDVV
jgi:hypothetical protein